MLRHNDKIRKEWTGVARGSLLRAPSLSHSPEFIDIEVVHLYRCVSVCCL